MVAVEVAASLFVVAMAVGVGVQSFVAVKVVEVKVLASQFVPMK